MESAANTTGSLHLFNGSFPLNETTPTVLVIALMLSTVWIISSNLYILVCLIISRHTLKHCANFQILSLSITDLFTGIFALLLTMSSNNIVSLPTFGACAVIWYGYNTSRVASFFHALGICLQRLRTIKRRTVQRDLPQQGSYKRLYCELSLIWVVAAVIVVVPFVVYGRLGKDLKHCSYRDMFGTDSRNVVIIISIAYLSPQISTSIIYVYIVRFLLTKWRRTNVTVPPTILSASGSSEPDAMGIVGGTVTTDVSDRRPVFHPSSSTETATAYLKTAGKTALNDGNAADDIPSTSNTVARHTTDTVQALEIKPLDRAKNNQIADNSPSTSSTVAKQNIDTVQALEIKPLDRAKNNQTADTIPSTSSTVAKQNIDTIQALEIKPLDRVKNDETADYILSTSSTVAKESIDTIQALEIKPLDRAKNDETADNIPSTSSTVAKQSIDTIQALEIKSLDRATADNIPSKSSTFAKQSTDIDQTLEIKLPDIAKDNKAIKDNIPSTSNTIARQSLGILQALVISPPIKAKNAKQLHNRGNDLRTNETGNRSGYKYQMHVLLTFGLIILVMNICAIPFHSLALSATIAGITPKSHLRGNLFWLSYLNSALNPFIYALRIKPFRKAMKTSLTKCGSCFNLCK